MMIDVYRAEEDRGRLRRPAAARTRVSVIADSLRRDIERGRFRPGDRLPSEADLTRQHSVSRTVVREAVALLRSDGLVEARKGAGVCARPAAGAAAAVLEPRSGTAVRGDRAVRAAQCLRVSARPRWPLRAGRQRRSRRSSRLTRRSRSALPKASPPARPISNSTTPLREATEPAVPRIPAADPPRHRVARRTRGGRGRAAGPCPEPRSGAGARGNRGCDHRRVARPGGSGNEGAPGSQPAALPRPDAAEPGAGLTRRPLRPAPFGRNRRAALFRAVCPCARRRRAGSGCGSRNRPRRGRGSRR